jgi:uncharacterized membrane protein HdeD (DUF308 family)
MDVSTSASNIEARQAVLELARWWWAWLAVGILWIIASMIILQFRQASISLIGVVVGIMFLCAGVQELVVAYVSGGWRWLWAVFGVFFVVGGIYALFNPVRTFAAVAELLGFLLVMVGIFWTIEAFATMAVNRLWWLGLLSGVIVILMGFWVNSQFFSTKAYTLLIFAGIWALFHGLGDIIKAFAIKRAGAMVAA